MVRLNCQVLHKSNNANLQANEFWTNLYYMWMTLLLKYYEIFGCRALKKPLVDKCKTKWNKAEREKILRCSSPIYLHCLTCFQFNRVAVILFFSSSTRTFSIFDARKCVKVSHLCILLTLLCYRCCWWCCGWKLATTLK